MTELAILSALASIAVLSLIALSWPFLTYLAGCVERWFD